MKKHNGHLSPRVLPVEQLRDGSIIFLVLKTKRT